MFGDSQITHEQLYLTQQGHSPQHHNDGKMSPFQTRRSSLQREPRVVTSHKTTVHEVPGNREDMISSTNSVHEVLENCEDRISNLNSDEHL